MLQQNSNKQPHEPLTAEGLKKYKGLENLTDSEAEKALQDLKQFARLLYKMYNVTKQDTGHENK